MIISNAVCFFCFLSLLFALKVVFSYGWFKEEDTVTAAISELYDQERPIFLSLGQYQYKVVIRIQKSILFDFLSVHLEHTDDFVKNAGKHYWWFPNIDSFHVYIAEYVYVGNREKKVRNLGSKWTRWGGYRKDSMGSSTYLFIWKLRMHTLNGNHFELYFKIYWSNICDFLNEDCKKMLADKNEKKYETNGMKLQRRSLTH